MHCGRAASCQEHGGPRGFALSYEPGTPVDEVGREADARRDPVTPAGLVPRGGLQLGGARTPSKPLPLNLNRARSSHVLFSRRLDHARSLERHTAALEALRGGIPGSFLEPLGRSWSH